MPDSSAQQFLRVKYVSDSFAMRQREIEVQLRDPESDYFLSASDYGSEGLYEEAIRQELEDRDYYTQKNAFWAPALARWKTPQNLTPKYVISLIVEVLKPYQGRVYDLAMGSGDFFVHFHFATSTPAL